ncbi:MAG: hypothetical protein DI598_05835 [Pseudopedobacter saltans]|uniref:Beta-carotene 15,15'-monooxygenase n=1 Tax=Pseudopedobacter saltans TaxID=151895 RepID=A0A2W5F927_9SPHI|nr:MAG: hypothetical protein DI598_05835 [Pseudopedobacter saltans]
MVSLFKAKSAAAVVWITLLCIFIHLPFIFQGPQIVVSGNETVLDRFLTSWSGMSGAVLFLVYLILVSLQANRLNAATNNLFLFPKDNALPGMVYVLFTALLLQWNNISSPLIMNTLFIEILATFRILHSVEKPEKLIFNLSMLTSVGVILYPPSLVWTLILLFGLISLSSFKFRLIIVWIIGLLLPFYFLAAYLFLSDNYVHVFRFIPKLELQNLKLTGNPLLYLVAWGFVGISVVFGILTGQQNSGKLMIAARKIWGLMSFAFLLTIGNAFLFPKESLQVLLFVMICASLLASNIFYYASSKWVINLWFWLIVLGIYYTNLHSLQIIRF